MLGLKMISKRQLSLITGRLDLPAFHLISFRVGKSIPEADGQVLGVMCSVVSVDSKMKDSIEPVGVLFIRQRRELIAPGVKMRK